MRTCEDDVEALIDLVLPDGEEALAPLRSLALTLLENAEVTVGNLAEQLRVVITKLNDVPDETGKVRIMTFHNSKGLTADLVVLAGLCDGMMPARKEKHTPLEARLSLEEGRRLFFVGLTRARKTLVLSHYAWLDTATAMRLGARMRRRVGNGGGTIVSPFVHELGPDLPKAIKGTDWAY